MCSICGDCVRKVEVFGALPFEVLDSICELCSEHEWIMYKEADVPSFFVTIVSFLELHHFLVSTEVNHGIVALKPSGEFDDGIYCWCQK